MSDNNQPVHLPTPEEGFDRREARAGLISIISGATVVVLVVMIVGVFWLYQVWFEAVEHEQFTGVASQELQKIHNREDEHLYRYAFIDKDKGVVRIPVDRAMEIVANDYSLGKVFYNTQTYPVKPEPPGGAAAPPTVPGVPATPNAQPAPAK